MEYQAIFEKVRDIVSEVLRVEYKEINLDFPLFEKDTFTAIADWAVGFDGLESNNIDEEAYK